MPGPFLKDIFTHPISGKLPNGKTYRGDCIGNPDGALQDTGSLGMPGANPAPAAVEIREQKAGVPAEMRGYSAHEYSMALEVPDIEQPNDFSCGAACAMSVGRYFGVGPAEIGEWEKDLGTSQKSSTSPEVIADYLRSLGLDAEGRENMTIADLQDAIANGSPVIVPVREYGERRETGADWSYGHYLVVCGFVPAKKSDGAHGIGYVVCQDPSSDNVVDSSGSIATTGKVLIHEAIFLHKWHDVEDEKKEKLSHYGIVVSFNRTT